MVYCGKPSEGCSSCRKRKIRDRNKPECGQCAKRQKACPGYRDLTDLMFRDESSHVITKAAKEYSARPRSSKVTTAASRLGPATAGSRELGAGNSSNSPPGFAFMPKDPRTPSSPLTLSTPSSDDWPASNDRISSMDAGPQGFPDSRSNTGDDSKERQSGQGFRDERRVHGSDEYLPSPDDGTWPGLPHGIEPPDTPLAQSEVPELWRQRAVAWFFSRHVSGGDAAGLHRFEFIYEVWRPPNSLETRNNKVDATMAAIMAVGLAGLSSVTECETLATWARGSYGSALRLINAALEDPHKLLKDSTMLAILILAAYEAATGQNAVSVQAWQSHLQGAAALAKLRGAEQFATKAGTRMFASLSRLMAAPPGACSWAALDGPG